ncbi:MAG: coenzyme F420-0:L-glutamate ligase [Methanospirillaceae archaeon]|nr:coenzyme F420-0:L-glutamate ligase [Methanospirillaceae archaeon]
MTENAKPIQVTGIAGLPLIQEGDDIARLICDRIEILDDDILVIATTIIGKAKGYTKRLDQVQPSVQAIRIAEKTGENPCFIQVVLDNSVDLLLTYPFILSEISCGHIGVRAGIDASNIEEGKVILLPKDPMREAAEIRDAIHTCCGSCCSVIITDTCGRAFRRGQTGNAIGWSGIVAIRDFRGDTDLFGKRLEITEEAVVDEIAGFANFVMGESHAGIPAVIFRNCPKWQGHDNLYFNKEEDLIRNALGKKEN